MSLSSDIIVILYAKVNIMAITADTLYEHYLQSNVASDIKEGQLL
jgi:hypothetical protein